jgi:hypothetical protein
MKIIFVPRIIQETLDHPDKKIPALDTLQEKWGNNYQLQTLENMGKFNITDGDQVYVMGGHGKVGSGVVFWGSEENWLSAETVAERTAARFPNCTGVSIKVYSCHSGEGGYNSFANRFARAFRPVGGTYEVTIFGYSGSITPYPFALSTAHVQISNSVEKYKKHRDWGKTIPEDYKGPKESVVAGVSHRWSKINGIMFHCRASEAKVKVAWLKAEKGVIV